MQWALTKNYPAFDDRRESRGRGTLFVGQGNESQPVGPSGRAPLLEKGWVAIGKVRPVCVFGFDDKTELIPVITKSVLTHILMIK